MRHRSSARTLFNVSMYICFFGWMAALLRQSAAAAPKHSSGILPAMPASPVQRAQLNSTLVTLAEPPACGVRDLMPGLSMFDRHGFCARRVPYHVVHGVGPNTDPRKENLNQERGLSHFAALNFVRADVSGLSSVLDQMEGFLLASQSKLALSELIMSYLVDFWDLPPEKLRIIFQYVASHAKSDQTFKNPSNMPHVHDDLIQDAIANEKFTVLRCLFAECSEKIDFTAANIRGSHVLAQFLVMGKLDEAAFAWQHIPEAQKRKLVNARDYLGMTPLHYAAFWGSSDLYKEFSRYADAASMQRDEYHWTPGEYLNFSPEQKRQQAEEILFGQSVHPYRDSMAKSNRIYSRFSKPLALPSAIARKLGLEMVDIRYPYIDSSKQMILLHSANVRRIQYLVESKQLLDPSCQKKLANIYLTNSPTVGKKGAAAKRAAKEAARNSVKDLHADLRDAWEGLKGLPLSGEPLIDVYVRRMAESELESGDVPAARP